VTVPSAVASFAVVAGLLTIIPGLDTALVLRAALTQGRRQAFATALGISTGALIWGAAAAVGVSALLTASHLAYTVLRIAGATYLVWLGLTILWRSRLFRSPVADGPGGESGGHQAGEPLIRCWSRGLATNLLNPKVGVFYVATLPQFIPEDVPVLLMGLGLALVHDLEGLAWFTLLIYGAGAARGWLRGGAVRVVDRITGTVLVAFGLRIALSDR
jgi:threonine/homoserine/homoserine lactone efflux protein